jgi:hypothetical protein
MITPFVFEALLVAVITEAVTEGLVDADPLEPVRHWVGKWHPLLAVLTMCGKCVSFWVSLPVAFIVADGWFTVVAWLAGWRLGNLWHDTLQAVGIAKERLRPE